MRKYQTPKEKLIGKLLTDCRTNSRRAKKVNKGIHQTDLTYEYIRDILDNQLWKCSKTKIPFLILDGRLNIAETNELGLNRLNLPSIDRLDNSKGYIVGNIQIVSLAYNNLKNRYDEKYISEWLALLKLHSD